MANQNAACSSACGELPPPEPVRRRPDQRACSRCGPAPIGPGRDGPGQTLLPHNRARDQPGPAHTHLPIPSSSFPADLHGSAYQHPRATAIHRFPPGYCPAGFRGARPRPPPVALRWPCSQRRPQAVTCAAAAARLRPCRTGQLCPATEFTGPTHRASEFRHVIARLSRHKNCKGLHAGMCQVPVFGPAPGSARPGAENIYVSPDAAGAASWPSSAARPGGTRAVISVPAVPCRTASTSPS